LESSERVTLDLHGEKPKADFKSNRLLESAQQTKKSGQAVLVAAALIVYFNTGITPG